MGACTSKIQVCCNNHNFSNNTKPNRSIVISEIYLPTMPPNEVLPPLKIKNDHSISGNKLIPNTKTKSDTIPDTKPNTNSDTKSDTNSDTKSDTNSDTKPDTNSDTKPDTKPDMSPDIKLKVHDTDSDSDASFSVVLSDKDMDSEDESYYYNANIRDIRYLP